MDSKNLVSESVPNEMLKNLKIEKYAFKTKQDWIPNDYQSIVDESVLNINFDPDIFQKQAFYFLSKKESVFVSAHTSSGKTLVAEYAIGLSLKNSTRVIYTSPIKALSNQKFYDFKQKFPDVGLITGDIQVNPTAKCLIMTTEILRNLIYKNSDILNNTEYVVFDEVHYINDQDRGVVWEECIIMLPRHISLVMLSATIPNSFEFSEWVGRVKESCIYVISTNKRAVPLEFAIYCDASVYSIDQQKKDIKKISNLPADLPVFNKNIKSINRFRINDLGNFVMNRRLVPSIFFAFSKKTCDEYGKSLQLLDFTTSEEKTLISNFLDIALSNLREEDRNLPQIRSMKDQVYRGIAVHHGALLPFVKECVEILFSENLIKILVATETFAMGVNMPAKSCVFLNITKIDNGSFRYLNTGEFIQMSGRAGRRGMDKVGTVLIADKRTPDLSAIRKVIEGTPTDLDSKFKLSFSLILMATITNVEVEELMRRSFKEHGPQKTFKSDMAKLSMLEPKSSFDCDFCEGFMNFFEQLSILSKEMPAILKINIKPGNVYILKNNSIVKVNTILKSGFSYSIADINIKKLFSKPITEDINEKSNNFKCDLKYPIIYKNTTKDDGVASFDDLLFYVKNENISFDFGETDIKYICKISELKSIYENILNHKFIKCPEFDSHYFIAIESKDIKNEINMIKSKYSRENLALMNEFRARVKFLRKNNFIDDTITLKGRVASEINIANDVLVAELLFNNEFINFSPIEAISIFSAMICEDYSLEEYELSPDLQLKADILQSYYDTLTNDLDDLLIPRFAELNFSFSQAVYDWCTGISLGNIVAKHHVQEGSFVRLLLRLDECCREMINISTIIGDENIGDKFSEASKCMRRDIVFLPSLYI